MNILAFDTSGVFLSVCVKTEKYFFEETRYAGMKHSEHLLPVINHLMEQSNLTFDNLDLIVCSKGPGSFTGLRIGMSTAKGISTGCNAPLVSVNTLDAMAHKLDFFDGAVVPVIDARKNRFYTAVYVNGNLESDYLDVSVETLSLLLNKRNKVLFAGTDCAMLESLLADMEPAAEFDYFFYHSLSGLSSTFAETGQKLFEANGPDPDDAGPLYIRLSDAELSRL